MRNRKLPLGFLWGVTGKKPHKTLLPKTFTEIDGTVAR